MLSFASLRCQLHHRENRFCGLIQRVFDYGVHTLTASGTAAASGASSWEAEPAVVRPRCYVVRYQLTGAELHEGRVVASYVAPCVRLFDTDELNVIWADLVDELGTSPYRLGLEILSIDTCLPPVFTLTPP
jgi:hypothetical protein